MDKFVDSGIDATVSPGLYTQSDIFDIESFEKIKHSADLTILCNRICFKQYKQ